MEEPKSKQKGRGFVCVLTLVISLCVLTLHKGQIAGDGVLRWKALTNLMEDGRLTPDRYSIVLPLAASPLYLAGKAVALIRGADSAGTVDMTRRFVRRFNGLVAIVTALGSFLYLRRMAHWPRRDAVAGTAFLLFGSMLLPHARDLYSECLWTLLSAVALWLLADLQHGQTIDWRKAVTLVIVLAVLVPLNPMLGIAFLALSGLLLAAWAWSLWKQRAASPHGRAQVAAVLVAGVAFGAALSVLENLLRRGGALTDFGYAEEGFTTSLVHGLWGQLVAPARGIVFFAPAVFAGVWLVTNRRSGRNPRHQAFLDLSFTYCGLLMLAYAKWHAWHGAWYWGPRFLLPLSVFGALYLAVLIRDHWAEAGTWSRAAWVAMAAASIAVYKVGATVNQKHLLECLQAQPHGEACYWDLRFTPLASWLDPADLGRMIVHRSSAVELATLLLLLAFVKWGQGNDIVRG
jgi:hypothetical protein